MHLGVIGTLQCFPVACVDFGARKIMNTLSNDRRTIDIPNDSKCHCACVDACVWATWHHYDTHVPNKSYKITISISANPPNAFANLLSWRAAVGCGACSTRSIGLKRAQIVFSTVRKIQRET